MAKVTGSGRSGGFSTARQRPALAQPWIILWEIAATRAELLLLLVSHSGEGHVSISEGCSPGPLCGQWAHRQEGGAGPGCVPAPGNVPTALGATSTCAATSRPTGPKLCWAWVLRQRHRRSCLPFLGELPVPVKGGSGAAPSLWAELEGWALPRGAGSSVQCPVSSVPRAVALPGLMTEGRAQRSTWLPALCILSPFIMSLFHWCCGKSWGTSALGHGHLLGERVGSRARPARAGAGAGAGTAGGSWGCLGPRPPWNFRGEILAGNPELPGWGLRDALDKVKVSPGLHRHCLGSVGTLLG